jgi:hypothetical protein
MESDEIIWNDEKIISNEFGCEFIALKMKSGSVSELLTLLNDFGEMAKIKK